MKLPLPFLEKKSVTSYFLVLVLRQEKAHAVVFEEKQGSVEVIGEGEEKFKTSIEEADTEELLGVLDKVISKAEETLPTDMETQKTVFGLKEDWVDANGIKKDYLAKLKKVSDELGLIPVGFLVINEAIVHLLQKEEGAPVSCILVETGKTYISVSIVRAGRLIEQKTAPLGDTGTAQEVDTLLKSFQSSEILPSRIIVFDGEEDLSQEFISHTWSKSLPFLHLPQITNLASSFDARAVLFGAAREMGFEVNPKELKVGGEKATEIPSEIEPQQEIESETEFKEAEPTGNLSADYFGFGEKDVVEEEPKEMKISKNPETSEAIEEIPEEVKIENADRKQFPGLAVSLAAGTIPVAKKLFSSIKFPMGLPKLNFFANRKTNLLMPFGIAILFAVFALIYLFGTRATVTITVTPKELSKNQDVLFSAQSSTNLADGTIAAETVSVTENGSVSQDTTGKKSVGEKAKGKVTIFNTGEAASLSAGTKITSSNDLIFTLDNKVTVPAGDPIESGKVDVSVTAEDIGTKYNLPSNTKFSIAGNSSILAKNDNAFSGGTQKDIRVVAKKDLTDLETKLIKDLQKKAEEEIKNQTNSEKFLLPNFIDTTLQNANYSKKQDEEADSVSLKADVKYDGLTYSKVDQISFAKALFSDEETGDLKLNEENIKIEIAEVKKTTDESLSAHVNIKGALILNINKEELAGEIAGKSAEEAKDLINNLPQVSQTEISVSPTLPFIGGHLPRRAGSISIVIK